MLKRSKIEVALLGVAVLLNVGVYLSDARAAEPTPINITASPQEVQQLGQLLDIATKSCGLQCAQAAVIWAQRLQAAVDEANKPAAAPSPH